MPQWTKYGDIATVNSGLIIHQVNAQGVMGSGVAGALRRKFPSIFDDYSAVVKTNQPAHVTAQHLGKIIVSEINKDLRVVNLVGQQYFGNDGTRYTSYDALDMGLIRVADYIESKLNRQELTEPPMIHYPLIGCGLGGAHWKVVEQIIQHRLGKYDQTLWYFT